jgi:hypothetical protein
MPDRLLVGVLGHRNSGKSHTWNTLLGRPVRRGSSAPSLELKPGESVEVFLVSGSFEERSEYAGDVLKNQDCRIVLCSMQYIGGVGETLAYFMEQGFSLYVQWLNPGFSDLAATFDHLGLVPRILMARSVLTLRNGQTKRRFPCAGDSGVHLRMGAIP